MASPNENLKRIFSKEMADAKKIEKFADADLIKIYRVALKDIKDELRKLYSGEILPTQSQMAKFERLTKLEGRIAGTLKHLTNEQIKTTSTAILDNYQHAFYMQGYGAESSLNMRMGFGLLDKNVIKGALYNPVDRIKWDARIRENTAVLNRRVREAITTGLVQGEAYAETVKRLGMDTLRKDVLPDVRNNIMDSMAKTLNEAMRIVRTEGHRARQSGKLAGYDKVTKAADAAGIEIKRVWKATLDTKTRSDHASMDGQPEDENGYFEFPDGRKTIAPGLSGIAEQDIHCRCDTITQFADIPYQIRRENIDEKDVIDFTSFSTWAKEKKIIKSAYGQKYNFY